MKSMTAVPRKLSRKSVVIAGGTIRPLVFGTAERGSEVNGDAGLGIVGERADANGVTVKAVVGAISTAPSAALVKLRT